MVNKNLFSTHQPSPVVDTTNNAGGTAYSNSAEGTLALFACTSCLNGTFYTSAEKQLADIKAILPSLDPAFIGRVAVYAHQQSHMKDLPALLVAYLASDSGNKTGACTPEMKKKQAVLRSVFHRVIDSGVMLRNFAQILYARGFGRKSFGIVARRLIQEWFDRRTAASIFHQSIGNNPTLGEVIKLAHVKPDNPEKAALFAYLLGAEMKDGLLRRVYRKGSETFTAYQHPVVNLPEIVRQFEEWKKDKTLPVPKLNFRFLDNEKLSTSQWTDIARKANWLTTLKNLNTYQSHGVFTSEMVDVVSQRLANAEEIVKTRVFPYQILTAYLASEGKVPNKVRDALHDALEVATANVPAIPGRVVICPDVSGSMRSPVTGRRVAANGYDTSTKARCVDVAALFTASILRVNRDAEVIPFETDVVPVTRLALEARDTVMTNARKLSSIGGGGTNCSAPLRLLNSRKANAEVVVFISDYESWVDTGYGNRTGMMAEWQEFKKRNPQAKLVCIDLTPRTGHQVTEQKDILQIGGFGDSVFELIPKFTAGGWDKNFWLAEINKVPLD